MESGSARGSRKWLDGFRQTNMRRGEIILPVCLHGTYHRGNAGILLQKNGIAPNDDRMTDVLASAATVRHSRVLKLRTWGRIPSGNNDELASFALIAVPCLGFFRSPRSA
jgi:hypothetical protein